MSICSFFDGKITFIRHLLFRKKMQGLLNISTHLKYPGYFDPAEHAGALRNHKEGAVNSQKLIQISFSLMISIISNDLHPRRCEVKEPDVIVPKPG
jgi:hypothetical protein